jgi:hypothetical protein
MIYKKSSILIFLSEADVPETDQAIRLGLDENGKIYIAIFFIMYTIE